MLVQALRYKMARATPLFVCYLAWNLLSDTLMCPLFPWNSIRDLQLYQVEFWVDLIAQTAVLIEITSKLLRPILVARKQESAVAFTAAATLLFLLIWPITASLTDMPSPHNVVIRLGQTEQILGVFWILGLFVLSEILALAWRARLLQITAGLFAYSLAGVLLIAYRFSTGIDSQGLGLQPLTILAYLGVLIYWMKSFSAQEKVILRAV